MRITRDTLLKLAKDFTEKRLVPDRHVTAVFLVGSVRPEDAVLPVVLDVDLLVIYHGEPPRGREIVKLSNEVHLDIVYENAKVYSQPRELRGDPWRGWAMWDPLLLHEKGRFFEYTQAIVRAQFEDVENMLRRSRAFSIPAREAWNEMLFDTDSATPLKVLTAAFNAANAFASLAGAPIAERKLLAEFPARAEALGMPEMTGKLMAVITSSLDANIVRQSLPQWSACFTANAHAPTDPRIHPARLGYYKAAIESQLNGDIPAAAFWPLLYTWALSTESSGAPAGQDPAWTEVCQQVGLSPAEMPARIEALDAFLDSLEETLEQMSTESGL